MKTTLPIKLNKHVTDQNVEDMKMHGVPVEQRGTELWANCQDDYHESLVKKVNTPETVMEEYFGGK